MSLPYIARDYWWLLVFVAAVGMVAGLSLHHPPGQGPVLSIASVGEGDVNPSGVVRAEGSVSLEARPRQGWCLVRWVVNGTPRGPENPLRLVIRGDTTVVAVFDRCDFMIRVLVSGEGGVEGPVNRSVGAGEEALLHMHPAPGWAIDRVVVDGRNLGSVEEVRLSPRDDVLVEVFFRRLEKARVRLVVAGGDGAAGVVDVLEVGDNNVTWSVPRDIALARLVLQPSGGSPLTAWYWPRELVFRLADEYAMIPLGERLEVRLAGDADLVLVTASGWASGGGFELRLAGVYWGCVSGSGGGFLLRSCRENGPWAYPWVFTEFRVMEERPLRWTPRIRLTLSLVRPAEEVRIYYYVHGNSSYLISAPGVPRSVVERSMGYAGILLRGLAPGNYSLCLAPPFDGGEGVLAPGSFSSNPPLTPLLVANGWEGWFRTPGEAYLAVRILGNPVEAYVGVGACAGQ